MKHYADSIHGWFSDEDFQFFKIMVDFAPKKSHFVEIGSFKGRSSSFMAVEIINSGKNIRFDCVDTWKGSSEHQAGQSNEDWDVVNGTLFETFLKNMKPVENYYTPIRMTSLEASKIYQDKSLDMVFIDATHDYINIYTDITSWLPKVKPGGYISGHDWELSHDISRAVNETLGDVDSFGSCWYKQV